MDNSFCFYQIRIEGELGEQWSDWFSGMTVAVGNGHAKGGILNKLWDLNLVLISVNPIDRPA
jgi:hypothetical protein